MRKDYSDSMTPAFKRGGVIDFDTDKFEPTKESLEIFQELNAISEEIEECRKRNCQ